MPRLILIVDDEPDIRGVLAAVLADESYPAATARDGIETLELIEAAAPDVVVSDVTLPRLDGIELVRRLRERSLGVPVVLVTALPVRVDLPGVRVLPKPFSLDELVDTVERCRAPWGPAGASWLCPPAQGPSFDRTAATKALMSNGLATTVTPHAAT